MRFIDALNFCLSLLGIYGIVLYLRYLLPCYVIPLLSALLKEAEQLLVHAEEIGAVPLQSEYRTRLGRSTNQFATIRVESHHSRGIFLQLRVAIQRGLTWKLYSLYYQVDAIKSSLELAIDKHQLAITEGVTNAVEPIPAAVTATPVDNAIEQGLPLPATTS